MIDMMKMLTRIFLMVVVLVSLHTDMYAKSDLNETNGTVVNGQDENEDLDLNTSITKSIIGRVEKVRIEPGNVTFKARIDTGATTTSLGFDELQIINEDGVDWAEVKIDDKKYKFKVVKYILIKQHGSESKKRPVVKLRLVLGNVSEVVNVTLADRSNFEYQLLIGRNYLYDRFIVDVSLKYTTKPQKI